VITTPIGPKFPPEAKIRGSRRVFRGPLKTSGNFKGFRGLERVPGSPRVQPCAQRSKQNRGGATDSLHFMHCRKHATVCRWLLLLSGHIGGASADVYGMYQCSTPGCSWGDYTEGVHWGYYSAGSDCGSCTAACTADSNCDAVECGDYCAWWRKGSCPVAASTTSYQTCRHTGRLSEPPQRPSVHG
jgi:hypothetical protein